MNTRELLEETEVLDLARGAHGVARCAAGSSTRTHGRPEPEPPRGRSSSARPSGRRCSRTTESRSTPGARSACSTGWRGRPRSSFASPAPPASFARGTAACTGALGRIVIAVHDAMADGSWLRLKALPSLRLRVGVHRPREEPLARVVLDELLREPREGAGLSRASARGTDGLVTAPPELPSRQASRSSSSSR